MAPAPPGSYDGTMDAYTFELAEPGLPVTSKLIRTTQDWGVTVEWEMHGVLAHFLDADFHLKVCFESIGPGPEGVLPGAGDVVVNTLSGALTFPGGLATRTYKKNIDVSAGALPAGAYKLVVVLQLYSCCHPSHPYPIAGLVELSVIDIFVPGP
jgi:hypothetical protein